MPINASVEFLKAQEEYFKASTTEEKLKALKLMLATAPKHKGAQKLLNQLKRKYAELRKSLAKERKAKRKTTGIKKEGAATFSIVGVLNSGKSRLFSALTNSSYQGENNYDVKMRMVRFENVWLQALDLPSFYADFSKSASAGQTFSLIRNSDVIVVVANNERELELVLKLLKEQKINRPIVAVSLDFDVDEIKKMIWQKAEKIRVRTKTAGKIAPKPVVLKKGATVRELAETVHQDFIKKFKYAKLWGPSAKFEGQKVGLEHKLADNDIVEIFTK